MTTRSGASSSRASRRARPESRRRRRLQIRGERGKAERRKQRVLDGPPERAGCLRQRRQDHLDLHGAASPMRTTEISRSRGPSSSTRNTRCQRPSSSRPLNDVQAGRRRQQQGPAVSMAVRAARRRSGSPFGRPRRRADRAVLRRGLFEQRLRSRPAAAARAR